MQQVTSATLDQRIDLPFYHTLIESAALTINFNQINYLPVEGPGGPGEVKLLEGTAPITRFIVKCEQLPDLSLSNSKLEFLQFSTYNHLTKAVRFRVVVDNVEIFGSAQALRDHGFFKVGDEIQVPVGKFDGTAFVRMEPLSESNGRNNVPYHRFFARRLADLPKVYDILQAKAKIKEISFLPDSFSQLLHEDPFMRKPESWG